MLRAISGARVLILTADIGAGHDLPAQLLRDALLAEEPGCEVMVADALRNMGPLPEAIGRKGAEAIFDRAPLVFDLQYRLVQGLAPTRRLAGFLLERIGGRRLRALIAHSRPDVIVSTYPGATEVLGRLRRHGQLDVPCVAAITDLAALRWWAHPGIDRHLIIHAQSRAEVEAIAGPGADIRWVRGLSRPEFSPPPARPAARQALGLPVDGPVVVVSGGGWGVGDVERAARTVLGLPDGGATAVCLCGSNDRLRARLTADFDGDPRLRVEGFTDRMAEWLAAADVLVHSTAGLTMLEAEMCGTWAISYGWGVGHIRVNNEAYRRFGLAAVATTEAELAAALRTALAAPRPRDAAFERLPTAASAIRDLLPSSR